MGIIMWMISEAWHRLYGITVWKSCDALPFPIPLTLFYLHNSSDRLSCCVEVFQSHPHTVSHISHIHLYTYTACTPMVVKYTLIHGLWGITWNTQGGQLVPPKGQQHTGGTNWPPRVFHIMPLKPGVNQFVAHLLHDGGMHSNKERSKSAWLSVLIYKDEPKE